MPQINNNFKNGVTMPKNLDADAEDDSIVVYPDLNDGLGETVMFNGVELPIEIKIYTTKFTMTLRR